LANLAKSYLGVRGAQWGTWGTPGLTGHKKQLLLKIQDANIESDKEKGLRHRQCALAFFFLEGWFGWEY